MHIVIDGDKLRSHIESKLSHYKKDSGNIKKDEKGSKDNTVETCETTLTKSNNEHKNEKYFSEKVLQNILKSIVNTSNYQIFDFYCNEELSLTPHWTRDAFKAAIVETTIHVKCFCCLDCM